MRRLLEVMIAAESHLLHGDPKEGWDDQYKEQQKKLYFKLIKLHIPHSIYYENCWPPLSK